MLLPNPASSEFRIFGSYDIGMSRVEIYNLNGQRLLERKNLTNKNDLNFNIEKYAQGMYFVRITSSFGTIVKKLVVN